MRALLIFGVIAACGGKPAEPDPRARCQAAAARDVGLQTHKRTGGSGSADAVDQELEVALADVCVADKWTEAIITCFTGDPNLNTCRAMLTPEQRLNYTKRRMEVNSKRVRPKMK